MSESKKFRAGPLYAAMTDDGRDEYIPPSRLKRWIDKHFPAPASPCGRGGMCLKRPDCSDPYCPGKAESSYLHMQEPQEPPIPTAEQAQNAIYAWLVRIAVFVFAGFLAFALLNLEWPAYLFE